MRYLSVFLASVGGRWFWLPGFVSGAAGLTVLLKSLGMTWLPGISYWALALFVILPISIWSIPALVRKVSKLQEQIEPQVSIRFEPRDPWVRPSPANTPSQDDPNFIVRTDSIFVRVQVETIKSDTIARGCQAYLTDVLFKNDQGEFEETNYVDTLRLAWSARPHADWFQKKDIASNTRTFVDLFSVDAVHNKILVKWDQDLLAHQNLFVRPGDYRFDVLVTADLGSPVFAKIGVTWTGKWDELRTRLIE